ncbi:MULTISPECIES: CdaR family protein [Caproicibacterium]|uniref:CdaR family protein n=1 Tax=Caproicibacterium argilliputei TaxID=3030016 RepID=A0AA97H2Q6_9FIRM|nr:CdaR family protein [Caproicibacterium argilliputei]WOC31413.1 CdaR family protein [Caproicibacterium argilliputei]
MKNETKVRRKKKAQDRLNGLFYNNQFVLVLSIVIAFVLWIVLAFNDTDHHPKNISDVPISVQLSDEAQKQGLTVYSPTKTDTVSVSITGNTLVVNQIRSSDIEVAPVSVSQITAPGDYKVALVGKNISALSNFDFYEISPSEWTIHVDRALKKSFPIKLPANMDKIDTSGYYSPGPTADAESVTISGPESEVNKIDHVSIDYSAGDTALTETKTVQAPLLLYDASGNVITPSKYVTMSISQVNVTIQVQPKKTVKVRPTFTGQPTGLQFDQDDAFTVTPDTIEIAGPKDTLSKISEVSLEAIDFSQINTTHNSFTQQISQLPAGCTNLSSGTTAQVTLKNMSQYTSKQFTVTAFTKMNVPDNMTATMVTKSLTVSVVGKESDIATLTDSNITAAVDLSNVQEAGTTNAPVSIKIGGNKTCWAYGTYQASVTLTQN